MSNVAGTMPEARFRTTKKKVQAASTTSPAVAQPSHAVATDAAAAKAVAMSPVVETKAKPKAKQKPGAAIAAWWPVGVGIFLCGFVPDWNMMAQHSGIWAERIFFPLALLAQHREIGIDAQMATVLPTWALYAQLPLEGLLTKLTLDRGKSLKAAIAQLFLVHGVCVFVLWLLTYLGK